MSKIAKHLILFLATLLLAFVISGTHGAIMVYFGYFCFGYALPGFLLKSNHETPALLLWAVLITHFAFVFEADRMMWPTYRPTADGWAVLLSVPLLCVVLRFIFLLIDRLTKPVIGQREQDVGKAYNPRDAHHPTLAASVSTTASTAKASKAYRRLLGLWFLWPLGSMMLAFLDGDRWDRMRYDNTLLLGMFIPPLLVTLGFFTYRFFRDRRQMPSVETLAHDQTSAVLDQHDTSSS